MIYVKIPQKRYLELVEAELRLNALDSSGVDNWTWYDESIHNYLEFLQTEGYPIADINKYCHEHNCELEDLEFSDFAEIEMSGEIIEEI